jgi:hypothetical protein
VVVRSTTTVISPVELGLAVVADVISRNNNGCHLSYGQAAHRSLLQQWLSTGDLWRRWSGSSARPLGCRRRRSPGRRTTRGTGGRVAAASSTGLDDSSGIVTAGEHGFGRADAPSMGRPRGTSNVNES